MYAGDSGISVIRMQATINADKLSEVSSAECREPGEAASPTVQCLSVPGRVFALQIEKVVSMDQMWAANTVTLKIYGPDCLAWLPPPPR